MPKTQRRINMRKLDQAMTALERAKSYVDDVGEMYVEHSIKQATELATVSMALEVCTGFYAEYGAVSLPIIAQSLQIALDILETSKDIR